jgi:hypothetical protein
MAQITVPVYLTAKLGSLACTKYRQGAAIRTKVKPKNPKTAAQTTQRQRFTTATNGSSQLRRSGLLTETDPPAAVQAPSGAAYLCFERGFWLFDRRSQVRFTSRLRPCATRPSRVRVATRNEGHSPRSASCDRPRQTRICKRVRKKAVGEVHPFCFGKGKNCIGQSVRM